MVRRGAIHTLDAFFAASIIVTALLYAANAPRETNQLEENMLEVRGLEALILLNGNGTLGRLVDNQSWNELELLLRIIFPTSISFNLTILDEQGSIVNDCKISNGGLLDKNVKSIEIPIAVESDSCPLYKLRLQLGGF